MYNIKKISKLGGKYAVEQNGIRLATISFQHSNIEGVDKPGWYVNSWWLAETGIADVCFESWWDAAECSMIQDRQVSGESIFYGWHHPSQY